MNAPNLTPAQQAAAVELAETLRTNIGSIYVDAMNAGGEEKSQIEIDPARVVWQAIGNITSREPEFYEQYLRQLYNMAMQVLTTPEENDAE